MQRGVCADGLGRPTRFRLTYAVALGTSNPSERHEQVWVVLGSPGMRVPLGVFHDLTGALGWIDLQSSDCSVAEYPVGISLFEATGEIAPAGRDPASFTCPPSPITKDPGSRAELRARESRPARKDLLWLWISHLPDRRPLPSAVFATLESAGDFIAQSKGTGAAFRYFTNEIPGVGGRIDFQRGARTTPTPRAELMADTGGELARVLGALSDKDVAQANQLATGLREIVPLHRNWVRTYRRWLQLVDQIEKGYGRDNMLYDYQHQLSSRSLLELILRRVDDSSLRTRLEKSIEPLDRRFMAHTAEWPRSLDPLGEGSRSNRVPINLGGRLAKDLDEFGFS